MSTAADFIRKHHLHAFPIRPNRKDPPWARNNLNLASADVATLKRYQQQARQRWPSGKLNWGCSVALSGLIVIDVDTKPGKNGAATMARFIWPRTLTVRTPSGGLHYYYRQTNAVRFRTSTCPLFGEEPDVDAPGYVLLPGSTLDGSGKNDTAGDYAVIDDAPIALAPDFLAEWLERGERERVEQVPLVELDLDINVDRQIHFLKHEAWPSRQGDHGEKTLFLVAAHLKDNGISRDMAIQLIEEHYNTPEHCEPCWNNGNDGDLADRLDVKVSNAYEYAKLRRPGAHTTEAEFGNDVEEFTDDAEPSPLHPSAVKERADLFVRDHYTVVNGKLYPKKGPAKGWRAKS